MNATTAALVWCAIQVTVLTCGVAVVYLAARRVHPRAGAAAAGGGLLMVIALTLFAASPWPRWIFSVSDVGVATSEDVRNERPTQATATAADLPAGPAQKTVGTPTEDAAVAMAAPSFWSLLIEAINRPRRVVENLNGVGAKPQPAGWPRIVVGLFLVGGLIAAGRLAWSVAGVRRLARSGRAVDEARLTANVNDMRQRLDLNFAVEVRESDELATPATIGWRRPVVLLQAGWREWSDAELRAVIAHELAHIAGRDYAAWLVARLAVVAHFYHPLVRWLAARLQLEQELAADMAAARLVGDPKQYLHSLAALALAMPAHRMTGPARTLFPSRSLLVRRVEMLRANGVSRPRRGAARYATFAVVALVGLAAAGLRGPRVDLAARAIAQEPADVQTPADDTAKTEAPAPVERIGLEVVPPDAAFVLSVRPADIASREELRQLLEAFGDVRRVLAEASIGIGDVAEVMAMQYGKLDQAPHSNLRIVVRFVTAGHQKKFLDAQTKEHNMVRSPDSAVWKVEIRPQVIARITELDSLTLVIDEVVTGTTQASLKNDPAEWADVWKGRKEQPVIVALDVRTAWQSLGSNADPVEMFGEGAFQTLYPLITDVSWLVADIELKKTIRLGGVFQAKDENSAETVRETLQATAVLLRNMARLYGNARPQGPDGNPAPAAEIELYQRFAGEADDLLGSAKFEANGSRVAAAFQPTLSTEELAQLIKSVMPSVEEARGAARRAQSMNNLKNIGLAMLNYEAAKRVFPAAASAKYRVGDEIRTSKFSHSWRVELLPLLEEQALYDQYRFDEPWDSEANKKVLAQMPDIFRSPFDDRDSTNTSYFVFTGPATVFPAEKDLTTPQDEGGLLEGEFGADGAAVAGVSVTPLVGGGIRMVSVSDGTARTFMLVEAKRAVPWTKPEDIEYSADKPVPKIEGWMPGEFLAALVDGSVHRVSTDIDEKTLRAWITRNGRENVKELPGPKGL